MSELDLTMDALAHIMPLYISPSDESDDATSQQALPAYSPRPQMGERRLSG